MNLFERDLGKPDRGDIQVWMEQVEGHVRYLQEQVEYGFRQLEKRLEGTRNG